MTLEFFDPPKLRRSRLTPCFEKLDKLDWPFGFSVVCHGVRIAVRANDAGLLDKLRDLVPADAKPSRAKVVDHYFSAFLGGGEPGARIRKLHLLYGDHDLVFRHRDLHHLFPAFEAAFRRVVGALAPNRVFVHAGVVGWKGHAILVPGSCMSGKTTLTAELVRAGATYLSDEYAVLDAAGRVHPFRKPLSIRADPAAPQVDTPVEALGGKAEKGSLPVGLVVMTGYREGAIWRPRTLTPGRGALEIFAHTTTAWLAPVRSMAAVSEVAAQAQVVKSSRGDAAEIAPLILQLLERRIARRRAAAGEEGEEAAIRADGEPARSDGTNARATAA